MADARNRRQWAHTSSIVAGVFRAFGSKTATPEMFNPYLVAARALHVASWKEFRERARAMLPDKLTEAEIEERWRAFDGDVGRSSGDQSG